MSVKQLIIILISLIIIFSTSVTAGEIHKAAKHGDFDSIKKLLKKDASLLNSVNTLQQTPLLIASYQGYLEIVKFLLDRGAAVNQADRYGATPLHMAALGGQKDVAALLISKGANINAPSQTGKIPLQLAFENEHLDVITLFMEKGVAVNTPIDRYNRTLLHRAAIMGKLKVINLLLEKGAEINAKDKSERTALQLAEAMGHKAAVEFLKSKGAEFEAHPKLEVYYIANEGFVIKAGPQKIMIDSLFNNGVGRYLVPSQDVLNIMGQDGEPFDGVKFLVFTHNHPDHFNAGMVETFMMKNKNVILVAPRQVLKDLEVYGLYFPQLRHRTVSISPAPLSGAAMSVKDLKMNILRLFHGQPDIQCLGYVFDIAGKSVCHLGDGALKQNKEVLKRFPLHSFNIDVAFIQYYDFLDAEGRDLIAEYIKPKNIVLMHVPPALYGEIEKEIEKHLNLFPSVILFKKSLEKKVFE
jgi:ankyrin repeat protein